MAPNFGLRGLAIGYGGLLPNRNVAALLLLLFFPGLPRMLVKIPEARAAARPVHEPRPVSSAQRSCAMPSLVMLG